MTTRTYPRTLGQAFPHTPLYACAVERPAPRFVDQLLPWVLALGFLAAILAAVLT